MRVLAVAAALTASLGATWWARAGRRALLTCIAVNVCVEGGDPGAIISLADGSIEEALPQVDRYAVHFPEEAAPDKETFVVAAFFAADGERVVRFDDSESPTLQTKSNEPVATLLPRAERNGRTSRGLTIAPSGKYVALLDPSPGPHPPILHVWDAEDGPNADGEML